MTTTEGLFTNAISTRGESSQVVGSYVFEEVAAAVVEETSSSIDNMIKELSQAWGSKVLIIEAEGASTSDGCGKGVISV